MLGYNELDITEYTNIQRKKNKGQKKNQNTICKKIVMMAQLSEDWRGL